MDIHSNIIKRISRHFDNLDSLQDVEEMYDKCINAIGSSHTFNHGHNGIIGYLRYYKRNVGSLESDLRSEPKYSATRVHSATDDAPPLVRDAYQSYKSQNPLLNGDETAVSMRGEHRRRFEKKVGEHIDFLKELQTELRKAKRDLDTAHRKKSRAESKRQRGESVDFNMYEEMGTTPSELKKKFEGIVEERIESDVTTSDKEEEDEKDTKGNLMMPYQLAFFLIKNLRAERENGMYKKLKSAYPEQSQKIERNIRRVSDLRSYKGNLDGYLRIDEKDIEYVKKYVRKDDIVETPEQYRKEVESS